jgi:hypothetical protein
MFRSMRLSDACWVVGLALSALTAVLLVAKLRVAAGIALGLAVLFIFCGAAIMARQGPAERERLRSQSERCGSALGMALGKASGGWTPRRRKRGAPRSPEPPE